MKETTEAVLWDIVYSLIINPIKNQFKKIETYGVEHTEEVFLTFLGTVWGMMVLAPYAASHNVYWLWGTFGSFFGAFGVSLLVIKLMKVTAVPLYRKIMKSKEVYLAGQIKD